jgi:hypothetical protein
MVNGSAVQSPSAHHLNQSNSSADIVILGTSSLPPGHPSHMHSQQQPLHPYQQAHRKLKLVYFMLVSISRIARFLALLVTYDINITDNVER